MAVNTVDKLLKKRNEEGNIELDSFEKLKVNSLVFGSNAKFWFNFDDGRVLFKEYEKQIDIMFYGHFHTGFIEEENGIILNLYLYISSSISPNKFPFIIFFISPKTLSFIKVFKHSFSTIITSSLLIGSFNKLPVSNKVLIFKLLPA